MSVTFYAVDRVGKEVGGEITLANSNCMRLMELTGLDGSFDWCGEWKEHELVLVECRIKFVLDALQSMPEMDAGRKEEVLDAHGGATMIMCGLQPGYDSSRLTVLLGIVQLAIREGGKVTWA